MGGLARDGTTVPVLRDQIFRRGPEVGKNILPVQLDHGQDWQPLPVDA